MPRQTRLTLLLTLILTMVGGLGGQPDHQRRPSALSEARRLFSPAMAQARESEAKGQASKVARRKIKARKIHKAQPAKVKQAKPRHPAAARRPLASKSQPHSPAVKPGKGIKVKAKAKRHHAAAHRGWERHPVSSVRGRCEPQSLTYARERSGIIRSRNGRENGPLTWFASESRLGKVSKEPKSGRVLILGANTRHGMPTGHVAYVETAQPLGHSRYRITFSHTNYDRRCSLETDIVALYDRSAMTLDISSGAWRAWGQDLKVSGFIEQ